VDAARGVGKHRENVIFLTSFIGCGAEAFLFFPDFLPFGFGGMDVVTLGHGFHLCSWIKTKVRRYRTFSLSAIRRDVMGDWA